MSSIKLTNAESVALWEAMTGANESVIKKLSSTDRQIVKAALNNMSKNKVEPHNIGNVRNEVRDIINKLKQKSGQETHSNILSKIGKKIGSILGFRPSSPSLIKKTNAIKSERNKHDSNLKKLENMKGNEKKLVSLTTNLEKQLESENITTQKKDKTKNKLKEAKSELKKLQKNINYFEKQLKIVENKLIYKNLSDFKDMKH